MMSIESRASCMMCRRVWKAELMAMRGARCAATLASTSLGSLRPPSSPPKVAVRSFPLVQPKRFLFVQPKRFPFVQPKHLPSRI